MENILQGLKNFISRNIRPNIQQEDYEELVGRINDLEWAINYERELLTNITNEVATLSCSSNSCLFDNDKSGMGTNSNCTCLSSLPEGLQIALKRAYYLMKGD